MSIAKRVLALAAAGATALVLGGVLSTSHSPVRVDAAGASFGALGCANSTLPTDISFPITAAGFGTQAAAGTGGVAAGATATTAPFGNLSIFSPAGVVECGAVFEDSAVGGAAGTPTDADPTTVDGGTITYTLTGGTGFSQILESNGPSYSINCGSSTPPTTVFTGGTAAVQTLTVTPGAGGTFTLSFNGNTTGPIAAGAAPATVAAALAALPGFPAGTTVVAGPTPGSYVITFPAGAGPQPTIVANGAGLTAAPGAPVAVTVTNAAAPVGSTTSTYVAPGAAAGTFFISGVAPATGTPFTAGPFTPTTTGAAIAAALAAAATAANGGAAVAVTTTTPAGNVSTGAGVSVTFTPALGAGTAVPAGSNTLTTAATPATAGVVVTTVGVAPTTAATTVGGLESCQGSNNAAVAGFVNPNPGNVIHVGFRPGATFGILGNAGLIGSIQLTATYTRYPSLTASGVAAGPSTLTVGPVTIGIPQPSYIMGLSASPSSINGAIGASAGSVITATLYRNLTGFACLPLSSFTGYLVCATAGGLLTPVGGVPAGATAFTYQQGVEPGVVTFTTSEGVFGSVTSTGTPVATGTNAFAGQVVSVQCGAVPGTSFNFSIPNFGAGVVGNQLPFFSTTGCNTASATLFGGGELGTALVTASFIGDITGAQANASTTVALNAAAATVQLSRGCNEVIVPGSAATAGSLAVTAAQLVAAVSPSGNVVSIWQFNNSLHAFQALYFSTVGAPTDISSVNVGSSVFICVSGAASIAGS